jgi:hypothetical protein
LKDTWGLEAKAITARELSECVKGSREDETHTGEYPRLDSAGIRPCIPALAEK